MDQWSDEESDASHASEALSADGEARGAEKAKASAPRKAKKKKTLDDATLRKLRAKLKAALYGFGNDYKKFFSRYDKDKQGTLDPDEFKRCVRSAMKVPKSDVSDVDIESFINTIDVDGDGQIGIDELIAFITEGKVTQSAPKSTKASGGGASQSTNAPSGEATEQRPRKRIPKRFTMMKVSRTDKRPCPREPSARWRWAIKGVVHIIRSAKAFMPQKARDQRSLEMQEYLHTPEIRAVLDRAFFSHEADYEMKHKKLINFEKNGVNEEEAPPVAAPHLFQIISTILQKPRRRRSNGDLTVLLEMLELNPFLLCSLEAPVRLQLARRLRTRHYKAGENIFEVGQEGCALYFILTGTVEMRVDIGLRLVLGAYGPGDTFGDRQLSTSRPRRVTAACKCDCAIVSVKVKDIQKSKKAVRRLDTLDKVRLLRKLPYFIHVPPEDLTNLAEHFHRRSYKDKEVICAQGETPTSVYFLFGGECRVIKAVHIPKGAPNPCFLEVHHYTGRELFGTCDLALDSAHPDYSAPMPVSIVAYGFCEVLELPMHGLHLVSSGPVNVALRLVKECLRDIDRWFNDKVVELVLRQRRDWTAFKESTLKEEISSYDRRFDTNGQDDLPLRAVTVSPPRSPSSPSSPQTPRSTPSPRLNREHRAAFVVATTLPAFEFDRSGGNRADSNHDEAPNNPLAPLAPMSKPEARHGRP